MLQSSVSCDILVLCFMFLFYVIITNTMAYLCDGAALAATRSPVIALFWCLIKFTTTTTTTTITEITLHDNHITTLNYINAEKEQKLSMQVRKFIDQPIITLPIFFANFQIAYIILVIMTLWIFYWNLRRAFIHYHISYE